MIKKSVLLIYCLTFSINAFAYLDPGSFSLLLQGLIAALAGIIGFFSTLRYKIIELIKRLFKWLFRK